MLKMNVELFLKAFGLAVGNVIEYGFGGYTTRYIITESGLKRLFDDGDYDRDFACEDFTYIVENYRDIKIIK